MRLKAFAGPFGVCYQVVTRTTRQLVALSDSHLNSISLHKAAAAVAPSRATTRCPASLLASRRTYTALYRIYPLQRLSRYKTRLTTIEATSHRPRWRGARLAVGVPSGPAYAPRALKGARELGGGALL